MHPSDVPDIRARELLTVLALGAFIFQMIRRERRAAPAGVSGGANPQSKTQNPQSEKP